CPTMRAVTINGSVRGADGRCWRSRRDGWLIILQLEAFTMAAQAPNVLATVEQFGPHLAYMSGAQLDTGVEPDRLVKTHCCFCGQQCGIQLKVKNNQVIGFEPWLDFPFNTGMLCPKGVKRYLQGAHPDRLLHAYPRTPGAASGFRTMEYHEAIRRVADEIQRIQTVYGNDAM